MTITSTFTGSSSKTLKWLVPDKDGKSRHYTRTALWLVPGVSPFCVITDALTTDLTRKSRQYTSTALWPVPGVSPFSVITDALSTDLTRAMSKISMPRVTKPKISMPNTFTPTVQAPSFLTNHTVSRKSDDEMEFMYDSLRKAYLKGGGNA